MNAARRKQITALALQIEKESPTGLLEDFKGQVEQIRDQEYSDAMLEGLKGGDRGEAAAIAISALEEAIEALETAIEALGNIVSSLQEATE